MPNPRTIVARRKVLRVLVLATIGGLVVPAIGRAQDAAREALSRGGMELSTAIALSVSKEPGDSDSTTLLNVPVRLGVMIANRLELEGEVLVTHGSFGQGPARRVALVLTSSSGAPFDASRPMGIMASVGRTAGTAGFVFTRSNGAGLGSP
jgi:hypothetical protein